MGKRAQPRPAAARAEAKREQKRRQKLKETAQAKAVRCALREKGGRLRDRVIKASTLKLYRAAAAEFYRWCRRCGYSIPQKLSGLDGLVSEWAEALYQEGEMKCILNRGLCGLAHLIPAVRGKMPGTWRLYHAWSKSEHRRQAPPIERLLAQAFAGVFLSRGLPRTAVVILAAHDCILRNAEFYELRKGDVVPAGRCALLSLRDTKMGQRLGVTQQVLCDSPWLAARILAAARATGAGELVMDASPVRFRQVWAQARKELRVKDCTTPYGLACALVPQSLALRRAGVRNLA